MTENIPRVIPKGLGVQINRKSWAVPPMFQWLQEKGRIAEAEMLRTFNMGVGMIVVVDKEKVAAVQQLDPEAFVLGEVVPGNGVTYL